MTVTSGRSYNGDGGSLGPRLETDSAIGQDGCLVYGAEAVDAENVCAVYDEDGETAHKGGGPLPRLRGVYAPLPAGGADLFNEAVAPGSDLRITNADREKMP